MNNTTTTLPAQPSVVDELVESLDGIDPDTPAGGLLIHLVNGLQETTTALPAKSMVWLRGFDRTPIRSFGLRR